MRLAAVEPRGKAGSARGDAVARRWYRLAITAELSGSYQRAVEKGVWQQTQTEREGQRERDFTPAET